MNWISVKERLPEKRTPVLVYYNKERINIFTIPFGMKFGMDVKEYLGNWEFSGGIFDVNITHWMPLPPPPKGDSP